MTNAQPAFKCCTFVITGTMDNVQNNNQFSVQYVRARDSSTDNKRVFNTQKKITTKMAGVKKCSCRVVVSNLFQPAVHHNLSKTHNTHHKITPQKGGLKLHMAINM
jgi:hypothetical protein